MGTKQSSLSSADEQESTTWLKTKHGAQFTFTKEGFLLVKRPYRKGKKEKRKADLDFRTEARKMAQKQGFTKMSKEAKQSFNIPNNVYAFADAWWEKQLKSTLPETNTQIKASSTLFAPVRLNETEAKNADVCSICCDNFKLNDYAVTTACGHMFHVNELATWKQTQTQQNVIFSCPTCKFQLD